MEDETAQSGHPQPSGGHGLDAGQARRKLDRLKRLAVGLTDETVGDWKMDRLKQIAAELNAEVLRLEERVAPKLIGKDAALMPVQE